MGEVGPNSGGQRINTQVSIGQMVTWAILLLGGGATWGVMTSRVNALDTQISETKSQIRDERREARRALDDIQQQTQRQFEAIQRALERIDSKLDGKADRPRFGPGGTP